MRARLEKLTAGRRLWVLLGAAAFLWFSFTAGTIPQPMILEYFPKCIITWTNAYSP